MEKVSACVEGIKAWAAKYPIGALFSDANPVAELLTTDDLSETWLAAEAWQDLGGAEVTIPDYYNPRPLKAINWNELMFGGLSKLFHRGKHRRAEAMPPQVQSVPVELTTSRHALKRRIDAGLPVHRPGSLQTERVSAQRLNEQAIRLAYVALGPTDELQTVYAANLGTIGGPNPAEAALLASGAEMPQSAMATPVRQ